MRTRYTLLTAIAAASVSCAARATILRVDDDAPIGGDGLAWTTAFRTLQDALAAARADAAVTEIRIAGGLYRPDRSESGAVALGDRIASFELVEGVAIRGGFRGLAAGGAPDDRDVGAFPSVLSGDLNGDDQPDWVGSSENSHHVVSAVGVGADTSLDGVTVTGGNAWQSSGGHHAGAGLHIDGGAPEFINCRIVRNFAHLGGGAIVLSGSPRFRGCVFESDWAWVGRGGALYAVNGAAIDARDCVFADNYSYGPGSVGDGGAAFLEGGSTADFVRCDFWSNESSGSIAAYANGGAVCALTDSLRFVSCRFGRNTALVGGALWLGGNTSIVNCEFNGNSSLAGGAIFAFTAATTIVNSTFVANSAGDGGAIDNNLSSVAVIYNSILWASASNAPTGLKKAIHNADGSTATVRYSCIQGLFDLEVGEDPIDPANYPGCTEANPLLADANGADNLFGTPDDDARLADGSPVADAGRNSYVPADGADLDEDGNLSEKVPLDLDGLARFVDDPQAPDTGAGTAPLVDMGAYERQNAPPCVGDLDGDGLIGFADLNILLGGFNTSGAGLPGDLDDDGDVDFADLNTLLGLYNTAC